ncbi:MAG: hypothetical protein QXH07_01325 [Thermoplasmata archaeon]
MTKNENLIELGIRPIWLMKEFEIFEPSDEFKKEIIDDGKGAYYDIDFTIYYESGKEFYSYDSTTLKGVLSHLYGILFGCEDEDEIEYSINKYTIIENDKALKQNIIHGEAYAVYLKKMMKSI